MAKIVTGAGEVVIESAGLLHARLKLRWLVPIAVLISRLGTSLTQRAQVTSRRT